MIDKKIGLSLKIFKKWFFRIYEKKQNLTIFTDDFAFR